MLFPSIPLLTARPLASTGERIGRVRSWTPLTGRSMLSRSPLTSDADRLVDRIAGVVPEDRAGAEPAPRRDVDAGHERVPVVGVGAAVVLARIQIVGEPRRHVVGVGERVGDAAAPAVRVPLLERDLQRVEVGVEIVARLVLQHPLEVGVARRRAESASPVGSKLVGAETGDAAVRPERSFVDVDLRASDRGRGCRRSRRRRRDSPSARARRRG